MLKVSIIIPIYNASKYVYNCLESIMGQTYKNIEIILIDDKSTDNSVELLRRYRQKYKQMKIISLKHNYGAGHARNVGLEHATGDYIFFIDSDDFIDKDCIMKCVEAAEKLKADVIDTSRVLWYQRKTKLLTFTESKKLNNDLHLGNIHNNTEVITFPRYITGKLIKRNVIGDCRFNENIRCYEDIVFIHQIMPHIKNYVCLKDAIYHYLQRPSSLINTISINHMDYLIACEKIRDIYESNKYYKLPIKDIIDNILINDIIVILTIKIPKMKLSKMRKRKCVNDFLALIDKLSFPHLSFGKRLTIKLFRSNLFLSIYFAITSKINLLDIGFHFLSITHHYKINDEKLKNKITILYEKMN